jgi:hypothetical protein
MMIGSLSHVANLKPCFVQPSCNHLVEVGGGGAQASEESLWRLGASPLRRDGPKRSLCVEGGGDDWEASGSSARSRICVNAPQRSHAPEEPLRVVGHRGVFDQGIQSIFLAQIFEEVFLSPAIELA